VRQRDDVDLQQLKLRLQIGLGERPVAAEARVVDERVNVDARALQLCKNLLRRLGAREVCGQDARRDAVLLLQLFGEARELVAAARDEDERVTVGGEQSRQLLADAARSASDERRHLRLAHCPPQAAAPRPSVRSRKRATRR
jgi:hypothetical protein